MPFSTIEYLQKAAQNKRLKQRIWSIVASLAFVVVLAVFWYLKLTGITLAGDAFCGMAEHIHDSTCVDCAIEEHIHTESCYSNITADLETEDDWTMSFAHVERGNSTAESLVLLARSQLGEQESTLNFVVSSDGVRRGITRYGQWYGNPYGDWSAMFASFCLHYVGVPDLPANAGVESMRLEWAEAGLYRAEAYYTPQVGNLLFLTENGSTANAVAIITAVDDSGNLRLVSVGEGVEDGAIVG